MEHIQYAENAQGKDVACEVTGDLVRGEDALVPLKDIDAVLVDYDRVLTCVYGGMFLSGSLLGIYVEFYFYSYSSDMTIDMTMVGSAYALFMFLMGWKVVSRSFYVAIIRKGEKHILQKYISKTQAEATKARIELEICAASRIEEAPTAAIRNDEQ